MNKFFISLILASIVIGAFSTDCVADANCAAPHTAASANCAAVGSPCSTCATGYGVPSPAGDCAVCSGAALADTNCNNCDGTSQAACSTCKIVSSAQYYLDSAKKCGAVQNCGTHASPVTTCTTCKTNFGKNVAGTTCTACALTKADTNCINCDGAVQTTCSACATATPALTLDSNKFCCSATNCATCGATAAVCATAGCSQGYGLNTAATPVCTLCTGAALADTNCKNCDATTSQATCTTCKTVSSVVYSLDSQNLCGAVANCGTHLSSDVTKCASCKTGYTNTGGTTGAYTSCVQTVITPVYTVDAPQSGAFNTTPTVVFTTGDTGFTGLLAPNGDSTQGKVYYTAGFTDASAYVWAFKYTDSTTAFTVIRRSVNATYGAAFAKLNGSDTTISTTLTPSSSFLPAKGPGYLGIFGTITGTNWNTATATASEITLHYAAVNASSFTTKAITGNTATTVYFDPLSAWYDSVGIFYIIFAKHTHSIGTTTVADTWSYNGVYIQGVNVATGALVYNATGGVQVFAITAAAATTTGTIGTTCGTVGSPCASQPTSTVSSLMAGGNNLTNSSVASYVYKDTTPTLDVIYYGSINLLTGAAITAPTAIATEAATVVATSTVAGSSLGYSPCGVLGSYATSGVFVCKTVGTQAWVSTTTPPAAGTATYVYSVQSFINGSTTASSVLNVTVQSGYQMGQIMGYGTSDGFVLIEKQYSTSTASPTPSPLTQYERIFTNGSASGTATSLGTFADTVQTFQDGNGSILLGYTTRDSANGLTYQGLLGKTAVVQTLALSAGTLTSIFAILSFMIVALFTF